VANTFSTAYVHFIFGIELVRIAIEQMPLFKTFTVPVVEFQSQYAAGTDYLFLDIC
jgi:hypothetical protein